MGGGQSLGFFHSSAVGRTAVRAGISLLGERDY